MDSYFDCPCGHAHHEHLWVAPAGLIGSCGKCDCWTYHGHRLGDEPHYVIREGLVKPTGEMEADHAVQAVVLNLQRRAAGLDDQ